jgi:hypothetical protein
MFKSRNLLFKAILFTVPIILCLWMKPTYGEAKREIEIKVVRQEAQEIICEVKVNKGSQFLLTTVSDGVMITAPQYTPQVIDDMVILMEGLGLYGSELLPEGHPAAIPNHLREYAQNKFTQSIENLNKIGHYPELYLLSGIKFTNLEGKSEQFFVQTSVLAGGTSLFMAHYSAANIKLMGNLMRAMGWQQVALFPVNQHPRIPAELSNEFLTMCEENAISVEGSNSLRTILVSPDYLSSQGI